jgi:hypothetical protein
MSSLPTSVRNLPRFTAANKPAFLPAIPEGTYLRYWLSTAGEQITTPAKGYGCPTASTLEVQIPRAAIEHHLVWENVTSPPWQAMQECLNAINDVEFLGVTLFQMLCTAVEAEPIYAPDAPLADATTWRLHYVFRRCPIAWSGTQHNWYYAWVEGYGWKTLSDPVDGRHFFRHRDFSILFTEGT